MANTPDPQQTRLWATAYSASSTLTGPVLLGLLIDWLAGTMPWFLIGGVFVGMAGQCVLIGGSILAAITAALGAAALWRITRRRQALQGRGLAWAAIFISVAWTAVAWPSAFTLYFNFFESSPAARPSQ